MKYRSSVLGIALFSLLIAAGAAAQSADMFVSKFAPGTANVGSNVTFNLTVGNGGPDDAANASFNDTLPSGGNFVSYLQTSGPTFTCTLPNAGDPGGTVNCSIATLTAGTTATFDITVTVDAKAAGTTLINNVTVTSATPDDNPENNTSITGTSIPGGNSADVSIVKSGPSSAPANSDVAYTITVTNGGPNDAGHVQWTDTLPTGTPAGSPMTFVSFLQTSGPTFNCGVPSATTTCSLDPMPNGSSATFNFTGHIPSGTASGKTFTNVASVTSDNDPNPDNDGGATTLTVSSVDVGVTKSGPATAVAGGPTFDYVITLSNAGPDAANDVSVSDNLPSGLLFVSVVQDTGPAATCNSTPQSVACTISLLGNGGSAQFTVTVQPLGTIPNGTVLSNTATATTSSADSNPSNNSSTANTTISAQADVSIVKSGPAAGVPGTNITYTITVNSAGPSLASNVSWSDTLPPNTTFVSELQTSGPTFTCTTGAAINCSIATFAAGASATFNVVVTISPATTSGTVISNTATITSSTPDPNAGNNSSTASTTASSTVADLSVTKSGPATTPSNTNVTYTVTAANAGPSNAANVTLTETVPAGMTFVSVNQTSGPAFSCSGTGPITCTIATFPTGASASFQFKFNVPIGATPGTSTSDTATISSATPDPNPANNTASVTTTIGQSIPALSPLAMALLAVALAMMGWVILSSRA